MMANIKIKALIISVIGTLMFLIASVGALGVYSTNQGRADFKQLTMHNAAFSKIRLLMETNRSQILQGLQHNPNFDWSKLHDHSVGVHYNIIDSSTVSIAKAWEEFRAGVSSEEEGKLADQWYEKTIGLGIKAIADAKNAIKENKWDEAEQVLIKVINPSYAQGAIAAKALAEFLQNQIDDVDESTTDTTTYFTRLQGGVVIVALIIGIVTSTLLVRGITVPLRQAIGVADQVAKGDLTSKIDTTRRNEFGDLLRALKKMNEGLTVMVVGVRQGSDSIAAASHQISAGNYDLSERTERQAANLEQTAAAMEELTSTVKQNADNSKTAANLASEATNVAARGGEVMTQVHSAMQKITSGAGQISEIINVIDGIAFQTNLLALNAAVEAARAGEQGRGFAVVAGEVRTLAHRSAQAAKQIKGLIEESERSVGDGANLVEEASKTMDDIVLQVSKVFDLVEEITSASQEQSHGIEQVGKAIAQLDQVTQQNAALVEESAAAAEGMRQQASTLSSAVSVFVIDPTMAPETAFHSISHTPISDTRAGGKSEDTLRSKAVPKQLGLAESQDRAC